MTNRTFRQTYCERFNIAPEAFERAVFWQCLYPHEGLLARVIERLRPGFFDGDLELIRTVGDCTSSADVSVEVGDYRYHQPPTGVWRRVIRVRVSGQRLLDLSAKCFHWRDR